MIRKYYQKLQATLFVRGILQKEIAAVIGRSCPYLTARFHSGEPFTLKESYQILDFLNIDRSRIFEFFPPDGAGDFTDFPPSAAPANNENTAAPPPEDKPRKTRAGERVELLVPYFGRK